MNASRSTKLRRRVAIGLTGAAVALTLTGCGVGASIVGLHAAATERAGGAPLNEETAVAIASRAIAAAGAARAATGPAGVQARQAVLAGSALAMAEAAVTSKTTIVAPDPLATPAVPRVLAIVKGKTWPRTILATTLDAATSTQYLHVLTSATPTSRFVLSASVPMLGSSSVPAIGQVATGVDTVANGTGLVAAPAAILAEYAAALAYPKPAAAPHVALTDALSMGLRANAIAQADSFKNLATVTQRQEVVGAPTAFRLADGSALVFGELTRTDTITAAAGAQNVALPAPVAALLGKATITTSVVVTSLETVVMLVPTTGEATVIGADDQLASAKGS